MATSERSRRGRRLAIARSSAIGYLAAQYLRNCPTTTPKISSSPLGRITGYARLAGRSTYLPFSLSRYFKVNSLLTMAITMSPTLASPRFSTTTTSSACMPAPFMESPFTVISTVFDGCATRYSSMVSVSCKWSDAGCGNPACTLSYMRRSKKRLPGRSRLSGVDSRKPAILSRFTNAATGLFDRGAAGGGGGGGGGGGAGAAGGGGGGRGGGAAGRGRRGGGARARGRGAGAAEARSGPAGAEGPRS